MYLINPNDLKIVFSGYLENIKFKIRTIHKIIKIKKYKFLYHCKFFSVKDFIINKKNNNIEINSETPVLISRPIGRTDIRNKAILSILISGIFLSILVIDNYHNIINRD